MILSARVLELNCVIQIRFETEILSLMIFHTLLLLSAQQSRFLLSNVNLCLCFLHCILIWSLSDFVRARPAHVSARCLLFGQGAEILMLMFCFRTMVHEHVSLDPSQAAPAGRDATAAGDALLPPLDLRVQRRASGQCCWLCVRGRSCHVGPSARSHPRSQVMVPALFPLRILCSGRSGRCSTAAGVRRGAETERATIGGLLAAPAASAVWRRHRRSRVGLSL